MKIKKLSDDLIAYIMQFSDDFSRQEAEAFGIVSGRIIREVPSGARRGGNDRSRFYYTDYRNGVKELLWVTKIKSLSRNDLARLFWPMIFLRPISNG